jgi:WD40 repeat protein
VSRARSILVALLAIGAGRSAAAEPAPDDVVVSGLPGSAVARIGAPRWQQAGGAVQLDARFDQGLIVGADDAQRVRIWSATDRRLLWQARTTTRMAAFALSADGARIAVGVGVDLAITDWRADKQLAKFTSGGATQLAWSPDGAQLAYGNAGLHVVDAHGVAVRDLAGARPLRIVFAGAQRLLYANAAGISALDLALPGSSPTTVSAASQPVRAAAFSADGARAAWTDGKRVVRVDVATGVQTEVRGWTGGAVAAVAVASSGTVAIYGMKQLAVTDTAGALTWKQEVTPTAAHAAAFSADGKRLVYGGRWLREVELGTPRGPALVPDLETSHFVGFSDPATVRVRRGKDHAGVLTLVNGAWAAATPRANPRPAGAPSWVDRWQSTSIGQTIGWSVAEANTCKRLRVWTRGRPVQTFAPGRCSDNDPAIGNEVGAAPWTIQDRFVIATAAPVTFYDATTGKTLGTLPALAEATDAGEYGHHGPEVRHHVAFAPDGGHALTVGSLGIAMYALGQHEPLWTAPALADVREVEVAAFSPDSQWALLGLDDGSVLIYATASGDSRPVCRLNGSPIDGIVFSPDGALVATTDRDDQTYVWKMPR